VKKVCQLNVIFVLKQRLFRMLLSVFKMGKSDESWRIGGRFGIAITTFITLTSLVSSGIGD